MKYPKNTKDTLVEAAENNPLNARQYLAQIECNVDDSKTQEELEYWKYQLKLIKSMKGVCNG